MIVLNELVLDGPLTEEKRPDLEIMQKSAVSLVGIINDILDLAKIEAGHMSVTAAPFDLESNLTQIVDLFRPQARARSTTLRLAYPLDLPRWFQGDGARVHQIISNLTSNAVQFTDRGDIELRAELRPDGVRISVCDTGIGIAPQTLPLLFEKFIQAAASVPKCNRGTGLGLAISKQLAELMGGTVGATSDEGRGSTFWVDLPLKPVDNQLQPEAHREKLREFDLAGARVLLAEDNVVSQSVMVKLLESYGMAVDAVANGRDALAHYGQAKYAVVLMDCEMPEMDGYEATRKIRELERSCGGRTPIIAITAHAMTSERNRCHAAGMDDCLIKPIAPAALVECIGEHLVRQAGSSR
jgi:CheY-like chemotaxis protein/anti-sigma regulatory factor (Ser/Thr protein kinase)